MIELKNVSKIYKSKKGSDTIALKNISIQFPEKGLVFILGKSGSGKSTLLNVIGGLDKYDDGEVIINGKSTKRFKEKDFDAFRNTYMGFIFQEYNLLESYSVEQNVKLVLDLQRKNVTGAKIRNTLRRVGLAGMGRRKTNELSGGQKQRVAIARAIIKDPEIILADEPTGNLDSETGIQIWDILKDISKEKLVIVVSHDEESAKKYADRIISIKDGEITSDEGNVEITNNQKYRLEKARVPFFFSFKMGIGSLFSKKLRLLFSSLLIIFSLICTGLMLSASTSGLNNKVLELYKEKESAEVHINKYKLIVNSREKNKELGLGAINMSEFAEKYAPIDIDDKFKYEVQDRTGLSWESVYDIDSSIGTSQMIYSDNLQNYDNMPVYYACFSDRELRFMEVNNLKLDSIIGKIPQNDNEVLIPSYVADCIIYRGCLAKDSDDEKVEEKKYQPKNYNELITSNKYVNIANVAYLKIVGIIDNSEKLNKYTKLKNIKMADIYFNQEDNKLYIEFGNEGPYNGTDILYVNSSFITKMKNLKNTNSLLKNKIEFNDSKYIGNRVAYIEKELNICNDSELKKITSIADNEIVIDEEILNMITDGNYIENYESNKNKYDNKEEFLIKYLKDNSIIGKTIKTNVNNGKIVDSEQEYASYKIIGVYYDELFEENALSSTIYYSQKIIEPLIIGKVHCYSIVRNVDTLDEMKKIISFYPVDNSDILSSSKYSDVVLQAANEAYVLEEISKYGIPFFIIFSAVLFMSFIDTSVRFRKKEIGTLKALGCRSIDIIKMFLYENIVFILITLGIAFAITPKIIEAFNAMENKVMAIPIDALTFGTTQMLEIAGIMLAIVVLANIIPVRRITKMKPIDAILNK